MLTAKRKNEIENIAEKVIEKYKITSCPAMELDSIMKNENILFFKNSFDDDNFDGLLTKNNDDQFCIYINTKINYTPRHNFTIAHELGHYFLKHKLKNGSLICNRDQVSEESNEFNNLIEQEANYFASCFLMPRQMFLNSFKEIMTKLDRDYHNKMYVDNQACNYSDWKRMFYWFFYKYRISIMALKFRLEEFNLIEFNWDKNTWTQSIKDYISASYKHKD